MDYELHHQRNYLFVVSTKIFICSCQVSRKYFLMYLDFSRSRTMKFEKFINILFKFINQGVTDGLDFNLSKRTRGQEFKLNKVVFCSVIALAFAQYHQDRNYAAQNDLTTPYPRNYHPPAPVHYVNIGTDLAGDYKFGYDTGKGPLGQSFREETRLPDGTVKGAYGVLDENGRQRIIRYTAGKDGFKAEGDIGPNGAAGVAPGPAPQPVANPHTASAPAAYHQPRSVPQYSAPAPAQAYNPAPAQAYNPAPAQQYRAASPAASAAYDDGQWDPRKHDPYYQEGPSYIDVERLSYNIGTARS